MIHHLNVFALYHPILVEASPKQSCETIVKYELSWFCASSTSHQYSLLALEFQSVRSNWFFTLEYPISHSNCYTPLSETNSRPERAIHRGNILRKATQLISHCSTRKRGMPENSPLFCYHSYGWLQLVENLGCNYQEDLLFLLFMPLGGVFHSQSPLLPIGKSTDLFLLLKTVSPSSSNQVSQRHKSLFDKNFTPKIERLELRFLCWYCMHNSFFHWILFSWTQWLSLRRIAVINLLYSSLPVTAILSVMLAKPILFPMKKIISSTFIAWSFIRFFLERAWHKLLGEYIRLD